MTSLAVRSTSLDVPFATTGDPLGPARHAIGFIAALAVPTLMAYGLDDRLLHGVSVWSKPIKFEAALVLHFATLLLLAPLLSTEIKRSGWLRGSLLAAASAGVLETAYIVLQAARGRVSHFNFETTLEQVAYSLMGIGATIIVAGSALFGWLILRSRPAVADGRDGLRTGAALGLLLGSLGTLVIGGYLGSQTSHWIGGDPTDATGLRLTGWSTTGGDLRPAHFLATHMMQVMPVVGLIADRLRAPAVAVWVVAAIYVVMITVVAAQALMGVPLMSWIGPAA
jgi:hypothetical protein